ncbi:MAG: TonB-dependent receptor [Halieaceae bacterium]|jgi:iron complex outermembrane recepter protein|nr:TonB-dependent receptor [Halieaceae bacterium]
MSTRSIWQQRAVTDLSVGNVGLPSSRTMSVALISALCTLGVTPIWAQSSTNTEQAQRAAVIEEIVVTARHRTESMQQVPIAISAVSGEDITRARAATMQDLQYSTPNLVFGETGSSGETFIGIRGIGDFSRNIGFDTRVGVYIDGVFAGQSLSVDQGLVDVNQVEVLRGPQGTLFGKNSSSGVINIMSNKPVIGETSGELRGRVGNLDLVSGQLIANLPLGETTAARIAVVSQRQDGYIDNLYSGKELMSNDHLLVRGQLRFQPSDKLDINFSFDAREQDNELLFLEPEASFELAAGNPLAASDFVVDQDALLIDENEGWGSGLTIDYEFDNGYILTSITGYREVERKVGSDEDATRLFTLDARFFEDEFEHFTQEVRLASPEGERFRYVVGAFYFDQEAKTKRVVALGPGFGGPPEGVDAAIQDSSVDTTSAAVFLNANFDITDRVTISGGLRYTEEEKDAVINQFVFPGFGLAEGINEVFDRDEDYVTATANIQFQATDNVLAYFTYSNGYKSGGFNVDLVPTIDDLKYEEETVDSFELGLKSDLFDGRLRLNLAAFRAEYDDYQVFQFRFDPFSGTTALLISNAASVTTEGFEVEGHALLHENFDLQFGAGYTDATFDSFPGGAVDPNTGESLNVAGNTLPRAPEITANITGRYHFEAGSMAGIALLNYSYRGEQFFNPDNRDNSRQGGYGLWNASIDFDFEDKWGIALWGRNLTDETFRNMRGVSFLGIPFSLFAQPRTYGVEAFYRF